LDCETGFSTRLLRKFGATLAVASAADGCLYVSEDALPNCASVRERVIEGLVVVKNICPKGACAFVVLVNSGTQ